MLCAGLFWVVAGANVLRIGIRYWMANPDYFLFKLSEMLVIFFVFLGFIFHNLFRKHSVRIIHKPEKNPFFAFFDWKSWLIVAVMISLGISVRMFELLPGSFIAVFRITRILKCRSVVLLFYSPSFTVMWKQPCRRSCLT